MMEDRYETKFWCDPKVEDEVARYIERVVTGPFEKIIWRMAENAVSKRIDEFVKSAVTDYMSNGFMTIEGIHIEVYPADPLDSVPAKFNLIELMRIHVEENEDSGPYKTMLAAYDAWRASGGRLKEEKQTVEQEK